MNSLEILSFSLALIPYLATHAVIIGLLLHLRGRLPTVAMKPTRSLLVATALPLAGPFVSSIALARLARGYQTATAELRSFRSDCGHAAGIAYGLCYAAAAWLKSPELGLLSLALLVLFFWQAHAARRALA